MTDLSVLEDALEKLATEYARMAEALAMDDGRLFARRDDVSGWSVAQHLHHVARSAAMMLVAVERLAAGSPPAAEGGRVSVVGRAVLLSGRMPRGKGRAPERTRPPDEPDRDAVEASVASSRVVFDRIGAVLPDAAGSRFKVAHPYFGPLDAHQWLRVATIHSDHHFRIIDEILA